MVGTPVSRKKLAMNYTRRLINEKNTSYDATCSYGRLWKLKLNPSLKP